VLALHGETKLCQFFFVLFWSLFPQQRPVTPSREEL